MSEIEKAKEDVERLKSMIQERYKTISATFNSKTQGIAAVDTGLVTMKARRVLKGHLAKVYAVSWSANPNHHHLVTASQDGKLIVWNGETTLKRHAIKLPSAWVMTCAFSPSGEYVASGGLDNNCSIFHVAHNDTSVPVKEALIGHSGYVSCCAFLDNSSILTSSGDATCILWDVERAQPKASFEGHAADVMSVSLSPSDTNVFVSGGCDASSLLWDVRSPSPIASFIGHSHDINSVCFFPSGHAFVSAGDEGVCRLFDIRARGELTRYAENKHLPVTQAAFSISGRVLFAGNDSHECFVWDTLKAMRVKVLAGHESRVSCLAVSSDGQGLATGSWDSLLKIWA